MKLENVAKQQDPNVPEIRCSVSTLFLHQSNQNRLFICVFAKRHSYGRFVVFKFKRAGLVGAAQVCHSLLAGFSAFWLTKFSSLLRKKIFKVEFHEMKRIRMLLRTQLDVAVDFSVARVPVRQDQVGLPSGATFLRLFCIVDSFSWI